MAYIDYTQAAGSTTVRKIQTYSFWIKKVVREVEQCFFCPFQSGSSNDFTRFRFSASDTLQLQDRVSSSNIYNFETRRVFRDETAWYHIVVAVDTTQSVEADRWKLWVNGVQETAFSTADYPSQDALCFTGTTGDAIRIGAEYGAGSAPYQGMMSYFVFLAGNTGAATNFGEFDATDGIWKIKTTPSGVTYGSDGLFLKMQDRSDVDLDSSGNANSCTTTGTLLGCKDSPSNNFSQWNTYWYIPSHRPNFLNLNNSMTMTGNTSVFWATSTLGADSGKYYAEFKLDKNDGYSIVGLVGFNYNLTNIVGNNRVIGSYADSCGYMINDGNTVIGPSSSEAAYGSALADGDILGMAVDLDNKRLYFAINGTWQNSADPSAGTGYFDYSALTFSGHWGVIIGDESGGYNDAWDVNWGNGYFGTTAISSEGTNASGNGMFEHDVPTGFTAWCTKGINDGAT